jgi:hypothetical protein
MNSIQYRSSSADKSGPGGSGTHDLSCFNDKSIPYLKVQWYMTRRTAVSLGAFRENEKQWGGGHRQIIQAIALFDSASVQR